MSYSINHILAVSRSGMLTQLLDLDMVSNNLANVNTNAYKSNRSNFQELLNGEYKNGVQLRATQMLMGQGSLIVSDDDFDLAIDGVGYFSVTLPDGRTAYTRDGDFTQDSEGTIVNEDGYPLVWDGSIPEDAADVHVNQDGSVMVMQNDEWSQVGTVQITTFDNPNGLQIIGNNLFLETELSGTAQTGTANSENYGRIIGNATEASNVNIASEITQMITLQRSYQMSVRAFQTTDTMIQQAIRMRGA
ncbi:MAG: flagellar hook-basal body complex protein [Anaerolineales bacterium]|nr:flagellar hook-basal body complex protein [Anaerolineales bacterium]